jgi:hypothetical protein
VCVEILTTDNSFSDGYTLSGYVKEDNEFGTSGERYVKNLKAENAIQNI